MKRLAIALLLGSVACSPVTATPSAVDLCWRVSGPDGGSARNEAIAVDIPNLETCAARLEALRMLEGRPVTGLYNGHFIFVTEGDIRSARTLDGTRFRVFESEDRKQIQQGIQALIDHQTAGKAGSRWRLKAET